MLTWPLAQRPCKCLNLDASGPKVETLIVGWFDWKRGLLEDVITGKELKTLAGRTGNLRQIPTSSGLMVCCRSLSGRQVQASLRGRLCCAANIPKHTTPKAPDAACVKVRLHWSAAAALRLTLSPKAMTGCGSISYFRIQKGRAATERPADGSVG